MWSWLAGSKTQVEVEVSEIARRGFDDRLVVDRNVKLTDKAIDMAVVTVTDTRRSLAGLAKVFASLTLGVAFACATSWAAVGVMSNPAVVAWFAACVAATVVASWALDRKETTVRKTPFVPHALSCALREYKVADFKNVDATVEQKLLRLATLPIPGDIALPLHQGTAEIARALSLAETPGFHVPSALAPRRLRAYHL